MEPDQDTSHPFQFILADPDKWLGRAWLVLGGLLLIAFFLPNYSAGHHRITGPSLMEVGFRDFSHPNRIFEDESYLMMIAVPIVNQLLALSSLAAGVLAMRRVRGNHARWLGMMALGTLIFSIVGAYMISNAGAAMSIFAKMIPRPAIGYWLSMALQVMIFGVAAARIYLLKRSDEL